MTAVDLGRPRARHIRRSPLRLSLEVLVTAPLLCAWTVAFALASSGAAQLSEQETATSDARLLGYAAIITAVFTGLAALATALRGIVRELVRLRTGKPSQHDIDEARRILAAAGEREDDEGAP